MVKPLKRGFKMNINLKCPRILGLNILIILILLGVLIEVWPVFELKAQRTEQFSPEERLENLAILEGNSLLPVPNPLDSDSQPIRTIRVLATGYSSTEEQTDSDPFITAAGTRVREGIVASNLLSFGTKIKIPELYGDKIFIVEDRMSWEKGKYQIDIWFPEYWQALNFGTKSTYIEILES